VYFKKQFPTPRYRKIIKKKRLSILKNKDKIKKQILKNKALLK
jgi:hypothetical protein